MFQTNTNSSESSTRYLIGIEPGSSRAKIGVAAVSDGRLTIYDASSASTVDSVRYGRISNVRDMTEALSSLIAGVEGKYPIEHAAISGVFVGIGGRSLSSRKVSASIVLPDRREITPELIDRLRQEAIDKVGENRLIIDVAPLRYTIDGIVTPRPVGTLGSRIDGEFTAVVCDPANIADLRNVIEGRLNLSIQGMSVRPISLAHLLLTQSDLHPGCMLVDLGAETTTVAIFKDEALQYLATIPLGSRLITRDLSACLSITENEAEDIKMRLGNATPELQASIDPSQAEIDAIIQARLADLLVNIAEQPTLAGLDPAQLPSGIILTGGGAKLRNFARALQEHTHMKVRMASLPTDIYIADSSLNPADYLDLIALLKEAADLMTAKPELSCITPLAQPETVIDINTANDNPQDEPATSPYTEAEREKMLEYGYDIDDFNDDELLQDDPDDADDEDPAEARRRQKMAEDEARRMAKIKEKAEKRALADAKRAQAQAERAAKPNLADNIITRITNFLSGNNADNTSDLD